MSGVQTCALPISHWPVRWSNRRLEAWATRQPGAKSSGRWRGSQRRGVEPMRREERRVGNEWSSDVCSSDLPLAGEMEQQEAGGLGDAAARGEEFGTMAGEPAEGGGADEKGRAACRE